MKRIPMLFLLIAPYLFVGGDPHFSVSSLRFVMGLSAVGLICGLNMVNALMTPRRGDDAKTFLWWNMVLKLCFVPLYAMCSRVVIESEEVMLSVLMMVLLGGLILILTTSSYGWRGLWIAERSGLVSRKFAICHALVHGMYFFDVISAVYCYWRVYHAEQGDSDRKASV